ncbi:putative hydro-lyase [Paraburkholderia dipogonis]|uniref:Putative hydro-lyase E2553_38545 n=1 Tax=Paraburkholderia dipogonis TaxID=1211383 RepID=A0A4Y8MIY7_9BURK|nr:putative hydro-lyase [Paraburkholderia dipogonis]TFE37388.1 putative hydro-lyase [Paraburkholderia dipogonis]
MRNASAAEVRQMIRRGELRVPTTGFADGFMQANLAILPESYAADFLTFCLSNPKSCPLIGVGKPGQPGLPGLGEIDIRTDVARYRVYRNGVQTDTVDTLDGLWRDDLVTFALGCSFSFESAILKAGIDVRHISAGRNVPMYVTNLETNAAGSFKGPMVVSMRALSPKDLIQAIILSHAFPLAHGAPVHIGDPSKIGIPDIYKPDFGDTPVIAEGDIPGFWACGVTPQMAIRQAKPALAITHEPGYMLVTDLPADAVVAPKQALSAIA